jgi:hypothetical protein
VLRSGRAVQGLTENNIVSEFEDDTADMTGEEPEQLADQQEDMEQDIQEVEELQKAVDEERAQWDYGHHEGILDALESLLSFRENMNPGVLLAAIHKIARRKLFDPPF